MKSIMFFCLTCFFIFKSFGDYTIDRKTNKIKIIDDKFFDEQVSFMILSINVFSIESMSKYQWKNPSVVCKILVVIIVSATK